MVVNYQIVDFWIVTPFSRVGGYRHLGETCCLHLPPEGGSSMVLRSIYQT
jgi:hypothetical protein